MNKNRVFSCGLILCLLMGFGCSGNRFKNNEQLYGFTFSLLGSSNLECQKNNDPNWLKPYDNGLNPSRTCARYKHYTCHISHYCKGDKKCEEEAAQYWTPMWQGTENDLEQRVSITKRSCEIEAKNCNSGLKNDTRCKHMPSEKYQKILEQERAKNDQ